MPHFYAGIDWSDDKHDVVVLNEAGSHLGEREVKHTAKGLQELNTFLQTWTGPSRRRKWRASSKPITGC